MQKVLVVIGDAQFCVVVVGGVDLLKNELVHAVAAIDTGEFQRFCQGIGKDLISAEIIHQEAVLAPELDGLGILCDGDGDTGVSSVREERPVFIFTRKIFRAILNRAPLFDDLMLRRNPLQQIVALQQFWPALNGFVPILFPNEPVLIHPVNQ